MAGGQLTIRRGTMARRRRPRHKFYGYRGKFAPSIWRSPVSLCPDRMFVKLRYAETKNYVQQPNTLDNIYRGNCHIDCDVGSAGVGFSAYGAEQWSTFYGRAYVTSSSIRVRAISTGENTVSVSLFPSNSFTPVQSPFLAAQRPRNRTKILGKETDPRTLQQHASTKAIVGEARNEFMNYSTDTGPGAVFPATDWYWHVVTSLIQGAPGQMILLIEVEYNVVLFDRLQSLGPISTSGPGVGNQ